MVGKYGLVILLLFYAEPVLSGAKTYGKKKEYTDQQKLWQGLSKEKKYTTCRLKKRVRTKSGQHACIYIGGNNTYELMIDKWCPTQYRCIYNPWQQEPNIDDVIDSLNKAVK
jgi:hypothetical protein|tara:strand:+ start:231 stop:566 length:336 start_codon:yes stop_codon:yes gene_type:complete